MNHTTQKQVALIQSHHNHLFTQPLPRQLRETGWKVSDGDLETDNSHGKIGLSWIIVLVFVGVCLTLLSCQLQPV